ncbi:MAG: SDR family NAD(P)-dependent oxidoreductase [Planctomycetota bacterium]
MVRQSARTAICPDEPRLDGKVAVVSGGGSGIGFETARGLAKRGAHVVLASRNLAKCEDSAKAIAEATGAEVSAIRLDLADLVQVEQAAQELTDRLAGRSIDVLVNNAGVWPLRYAASPQGHEIAFAVNVLGHHAWTMRLIESGQLDNGRVVVLTGDIYAFVKQCTPDYRYRTPVGGQWAYCRSKLGNLWCARELARRFPALVVAAVHPGVVASELGNAGSPLLAWMKRRAPLMSIELGAQTSLIAATQPDIVSGGYYHNTFGRVELPPIDPGADRTKAEALWETLERLRQPPFGEPGR